MIIKLKLTIIAFLICLCLVNNGYFQNEGKGISPDLFGIFYEAIIYAADGGPYAELLQKRSFEYSPGDAKIQRK